MSNGLFAVGVPGQRVRLFIRAAPEHIVNQLGEDEWAVEAIEAVPSVMRADKSGVDPLAPSADDELQKVRAERWSRLLESDWTQVGDSPLSDELRAAWRTYRQALRDIFIDQPDVTPGTVIWPEKPST
ncbi:tail fiber assembly protein [Sphingobium cupriresistens]|uniref:Phage tail assembly chaperone-like domain-containing protein n=1 Tax=Sphingobium cupriresistens TaxID=1132417 RepID=A0A8G1ZDE3_9SPHN|nr:tail fiber assembly protein [Sphingobium cupriresistens]RYM07991.1 hypothetical protein EWH12_17810 [Sphingobium cupriresistens]